MIGGALAGFGWWMLRRRTEVPPLAETIANHRPIPAPDVDARRGTAGADRRLGRLPGPRGCTTPIRRRPGRSRDIAMVATPRDREILLACAAGAGLPPSTAFRSAARCSRRAIMLNTWHPAGARHRPDHLEPRGRRRLARHPRGHTAGLAGPAIVLSADGFRGCWRHWHSASGCVQPTHGAGTARQTMKSWLLIPAIAAAGLLIGVCSIGGRSSPATARAS